MIEGDNSGSGQGVVGRNNSSTVSAVEGEEAGRLAQGPQDEADPVFAVDSPGRQPGGGLVRARE